MKPNFHVHFSLESGLMEPRFVCAFCREIISDIQNAALVSPVTDEDTNWEDAMVMHVQPCMEEYERVQEISLGSFNLDDAVRWMCFNALADANVLATQTFLAKLKDLQESVESLVAERGGDVNYKLPWADEQPNEE